MILTSNDIQAKLGDDVKLKAQPAGGNGDGNVTVTATDRATNRMISGGLSVSPSSASVGAAVSLMNNKDIVLASIGQGSSAEAEGDLKVSSEVGGTAQAFTAALSMAVSVPIKKKDKKTGKTSTTGSSQALAGAVNYIVNTAKATTETGDDTSLTAGGDAALDGKLAAGEALIRDRFGERRRIRK